MTVHVRAGGGPDGVEQVVLEDLDVTSAEVTGRGPDGRVESLAYFPLEGTGLLSWRAASVGQLLGNGASGTGVLVSVRPNVGASLRVVVADRTGARQGEPVAAWIADKFVIRRRHGFETECTWLRDDIPLGSCWWDSVARRWNAQGGDDFVVGVSAVPWRPPQRANPQDEERLARRAGRSLDVGLLLRVHVVGRDEAGAEVRHHMGDFRAVVLDGPSMRGDGALLGHWRPDGSMQADGRLFDMVDLEPVDHRGNVQAQARIMLRGGRDVVVAPWVAMRRALRSGRAVVWCGNVAFTLWPNGEWVTPENMVPANGPLVLTATREAERPWGPGAGANPQDEERLARRGGEASRARAVGGQVGLEVFDAETLPHEDYPVVRTCGQFAFDQAGKLVGWGDADVPFVVAQLSTDPETGDASWAVAGWRQAVRWLHLRPVDKGDELLVVASGDVQRTTDELTVLVDRSTGTLRVRHLFDPSGFLGVPGAVDGSSDVRLADTPGRNGFVVTAVRKHPARNPQDEERLARRADGGLPRIKATWVPEDDDQLPMEMPGDVDFDCTDVVLRGRASWVRNLWDDQSASDELAQVVDLPEWEGPFRVEVEESLRAFLEWHGLEQDRVTDRDMGRLRRLYGVRRLNPQDEERLARRSRPTVPASTAPPPLAVTIMRPPPAMHDVSWITSFMVREDARVVAWTKDDPWEPFVLAEFAEGGTVDGTGSPLGHGTQLVVESRDRDVDDALTVRFGAREFVADRFFMGQESGSTSWVWWRRGDQETGAARRDPSTGLWHLAEGHVWGDGQRDADSAPEARVYVLARSLWRPGSVPNPQDEERLSRRGTVAARDALEVLRSLPFGHPERQAVALAFGRELLERGWFPVAGGHGRELLVTAEQVPAVARRWGRARRRRVRVQADMSVLYGDEGILRSVAQGVGFRFAPTSDPFGTDEERQRDVLDVLMADPVSSAILAWGGAVAWFRVGAGALWPHYVAPVTGRRMVATPEGGLALHPAMGFASPGWRAPPTMTLVTEFMRTLMPVHESVHPVLVRRFLRLGALPTDLSPQAALNVLRSDATALPWIHARIHDVACAFAADMAMLGLMAPPEALAERRVDVG